MATPEITAMRRILVLGCAGAGKTVFSDQLATLTGLPVIRLDQEYWKPGWVEPETTEWRERVATLADRDKWIMDGNYGGTLDLRLKRADRVYILDVSRTRALARVVWRTARNWGKTRADMTQGCVERIDGPFLAYIWTYNRVHRPRLMEALASHKGRSQILTGPKAARDHLRLLATALSSPPSPPPTM
ncbi:hypothetical protein [Rhodospirillum sp. A1_3_36]|uniref:hypothetical protein n=1 Tax=Rhodospirillum sp. A1_3_36 TaxID=3391666 RepID=UPI0039A4B931